MKILCLREAERCVCLLGSESVGSIPSLLTLPGLPHPPPKCLLCHKSHWMDRGGACGIFLFPVTLTQFSPPGVPRAMR